MCCYAVCVGTVALAWLLRLHAAGWLEHQPARARCWRAGQLDTTRALCSLPSTRVPSPQVTRAALGNDCTLVCGWSNQECARYLETFKRRACRRGSECAEWAGALAACARRNAARHGRLARPSTPVFFHASPLSSCSYEHKPAEVIQKDLGSDYLSRINAALTSVRGVNRTDVKTLGDR